MFAYILKSVFASSGSFCLITSHISMKLKINLNNEYVSFSSMFAMYSFQGTKVLKLTLLPVQKHNYNYPNGIDCTDEKLFKNVLSSLWFLLEFVVTCECNLIFNIFIIEIFSNFHFCHFFIFFPSFICLFRKGDYFIYHIVYKKTKGMQFFRKGGSLHVNFTLKT